MMLQRVFKLLCAPTTIVCACVVALSSCSQKDHGELQWARAALERNPQVKVLAVDADKNTIQVRVKATGETLTLVPGELAAIPIGELMTLKSATPIAAIPAPTTIAAPEPVRAETPVPPELPTPPVEPAKPEYKVEREEGRVRISGPGVSIESGKSASQETVAQHFDEPIVCDGKRMLHFDNRRINVDGDAIVARGGCELHITNSRITATGTAITVLDATVHIANSEVRGEGGSLTTSSAAHAFLNNTKFTGLARRDPQATIQDQGGNSWR